MVAAMRQTRDQKERLAAEARKALTGKIQLSI
jgi:hypothetical protein